MTRSLFKCTDIDNTLIGGTCTLDSIRLSIAFSKDEKEHITQWAEIAKTGDTIVVSDVIIEKTKS